MQQTYTGHHLVLYDGVCGLCNGLVRFVIPRDKAGVFRFASLQSDFAHQFLLKSGIDSIAGDTIYVVPNFESAESTVLSRADASLFIASQLGRPWSWLAVMRVLPSGWLGAAYDFTARHRYRWFGQYSSCPLPSVRDKWRFLDI